MARKKIVFVIVEGPSDETALGVLLSKIYDSNSVYVHIAHGDITSCTSYTPRNIVAEIGNIVKSYASANHYKKSDFGQIIHIVDMDGAYIPDTAVTEDNSIENVIYSLTSILTGNKTRIVNRNSHKAANLNRIVGCNVIWTEIPYRAFYMSCNLDHALYGILNCTDEEKEEYAYKFAKMYHNDIASFVDYVTKSDFSAIGNYADTWNYIKEGLHSLERHTNLGLCLLDQE